jgi:hypothetical protein
MNARGPTCVSRQRAGRRAAVEGNPENQITRLWPRAATSRLQHPVITPRNSRSGACMLAARLGAAWKPFSPRSPRLACWMAKRETVDLTLSDDDEGPPPVTREEDEAGRKRIMAFASTVNAAKRPRPDEPAAPQAQAVRPAAADAPAPGAAGGAGGAGGNSLLAQLHAGVWWGPLSRAWRLVLACNSRPHPRAGRTNTHAVAPRPAAERLRRTGPPAAGTSGDAAQQPSSNPGPSSSLPAPAGAAGQQRRAAPSSTTTPAAPPPEISLLQYNVW